MKYRSFITFAYKPITLVNKHQMQFVSYMPKVIWNRIAEFLQIIMLNI